METTEKKHCVSEPEINLPNDFFFARDSNAALPPQCALLPKLTPTQFEFWFSKDPDMALPLVARYNYLKKIGQIPENVSYEEWQQAFPVSDEN